MECKKQGAKNKVIVIQKEKEQLGLFFFWLTMTLFFAPCFLHPIFWTQFFSKVANWPMFLKREYQGEDWLVDCIVKTVRP